MDVFVDDYYDEVICSSKEYWADATHMNDIGAWTFSTKTVKMLRIIMHPNHESKI
jgi:hypothetical protein